MLLWEEVRHNTALFIKCLKEQNWKENNGKIRLFRSLKKEGGLENLALKLGYNHTNIPDKIELFELSGSIILYAQDVEFFMRNLTIVKILIKMKLILRLNKKLW